MPAKAKLTTRNTATTTVTADNLAKGTELSFNEADSNFINLRDQSFGLVGDDSAGVDVQSGQTITVTGTGGITVAVANDTVTIDGSSVSGSALNNIVEDTTPQLGGNLDVNGQSIVSIANGNITITPNGTGKIILNGDVNLVGALNSDGSNGDIRLTPNGTGQIVLDWLNWPTADGSSGQVLTTNGLGQLSWSNKTSLGDLSISGSTISSSSGSVTFNPSINANSTFKFNKDYEENISALTSSSTITVDCSLSSVFSVTLAHSATFTFSNLGTGQSAVVIITQDATGNRTGSFTSVKFPGAVSTLSTGVGDIDIISVFNDGTNLLGNISKDYS